MTNKIRRVTCVILALVLLLSANAYAVDDLGESTFTGTIIVDSESPKLLNLGEIEIEVYQSTPIETDESYTIYSEEYAFSVYPDENGIFTFDRPSSVFSITVQVDSLPDGYGISHHTSLYSPEITSDIFTLSIVDEAEIVADSLKYPEIMLFNADGEEVYAVYEFEPTYQVLPRNDDIVEISGTVNLNSGSITRAKGQFEKYLSSPETTMQDTKYGNGVFPMAIDVAYGGSATIRKIYERLNSVGSKDMSETQLENAITWAIQQYDSSGSFAEAFKKLGAYITLPDHFFASVIPSNASWSNGHINRYTPTTTEKSISVTLESFGLKPFELRPNSSTSPQDLEVVIDFSGVRSTTNSVRFVKETASGSIIPFGTDATAVRYSAVINPFGNATSAANNIVDLYVAPINAGSYDRRINITYQLAG